jgi:hypothetical protein
MGRSISTRIESTSYYSYYKNYPTAYLFGSEFVLTQELSHSFPLLNSQAKKDLFSVKDSVLTISPFRIEKFGQVYVNPQELIIDFQKIKGDVYRIVAVHNFQVEDCNPNLTECLAGIFLARQIEGKWEEPENHPIECRTIDILAYINTETGRIFYL